MTTSFDNLLVYGGRRTSARTLTCRVSASVHDHSNPLERGSIAQGHSSRGLRRAYARVRADDTSVTLQRVDASTARASTTITFIVRAVKIVNNTARNCKLKTALTTGGLPILGLRTGQGTMKFSSVPNRIALDGRFAAVEKLRNDEIIISSPKRGSKSRFAFLRSWEIVLSNSQ
ncbi:hypothetical protein T492DRAFT_839652 [Pavlovales sp. CCMP2436]|nr:hypothetical protein T492DRAFT_839652 [Pavlovales sp. CCMP2436]